MKRTLVISIVVFFISGFMLGCACQKSQMDSQELNISSKFNEGYMKKVDGFLVILDSSSSMVESYEEQEKLDVAKTLIQRMNLTIPSLKLSAGMRIFGGKLDILTKYTELRYGMEAYKRSELTSALQSVDCAIGRSPMAKALDAAGTDLGAVDGRLAVILFSDGKIKDDDPMPAADNLKSRYGNRLCIYTVLVGDDARGESLLEGIAQVGGCGFAVSGDQLASAEGMADFVEKVFLAPIPPPKDSDGDGVTDDLDQCPDTPRGAQVDARGCPLDSDGDGVADYMDKCPDTPKGIQVGAGGCPLDADGDGVVNSLDKCPDTPLGAKVNTDGCWVIENLQFDFDKSVVKLEDVPELDHVVEVMKQNPSLRLEIQGHTCNTGPAEYNGMLSNWRAGAVKDYLVQKGVAEDRLSTKGFGPDQPVADNNTSEGRVRNRRVELNPQ